MISLSGKFSAENAVPDDKVAVLEAISRPAVPAKIDFQKDISTSSFTVVIADN
jgi:hypothetical protein